MRFSASNPLARASIVLHKSPLAPTRRMSQYAFGSQTRISAKNLFVLRAVYLCITENHKREVWMNFILPFAFSQKPTVVFLLNQVNFIVFCGFLSPFGRSAVQSTATFAQTRISPSNPLALVTSIFLHQIPLLLRLRVASEDFC